MEGPLSDRFRDLTVADFLGRLASADPVPGGGSASAVTAATAAALVAMVARLSIGRPKYAQHEAMLVRTQAAATALVDRCLDIADRDAAAFGGFAAAMKLPRETEAEKAARTSAMQAAAPDCAVVPLEAVEACRDILGLAESLAGRSNQNASSDLRVAALLAEAGARGAAENVAINLPTLGDDATAERLGRVAAEFLAEVEHLAARTHEVVASGVIREPLPVVPEAG